MNIEESKMKEQCSDTLCVKPKSKSLLVFLPADGSRKMVELL